MTGLDEGRTGNGEPGPEAGSAPFFPGPAARRTAHSAAHRGAVPPPGTPLPAPPAAGAAAVPMTLRGSPSDITTGVEGRVTIADEVIGKIAALAALEVAGVAALIARPGPAGEAGPHGAGRGGTGVHVDPDEDEVTLDLAIAVEYGSVIRDVADAVKANVARVAGLMLGSRVAAVNVAVGDVRKAAGPHR
ncbi:Asp23/Gls24 family envelope stress response protein [Actinomadura sp. 7K534]|uniref:Asp23/Gls24 family envelope stress response protein n=1 Tax=Actinomadura sp. 7K534 TaxID=2530366 RepID=UPI00104F43B0|nr:Asp23/Gls24 family envelope stress response protein [Actinomadura sp. 7K534]TDB98427.1 Asp23/Gls24 family envelope stress response protein [Actinomadura sp. 7K534]